MVPPRYAVGIDLGTSNCALASLDLNLPDAVSRVFDIPQASDAARRSASPTLPSCLYLPPDGGDWVPGLWARDMSFTQPGRVLHSAKSWLCHPAVDREARLLPWQSSDLPPDLRLSPVEASARLLRHLREAWEAAHGLPLAEQALALTVPASFDAAALQLTLEAALLAGLPADTHLMEEPQAAFYRWLEESPSLAVDRPSTLLVIDIGGGTTDFSLFDIEPGTPPRIRRRAVGEHLLLGGDNLDRRLAESFRQALETDAPALTARQLGFLLAESRRLKEALLTPGIPVPAELLLPASGAGLFAGTRSVPVDAPRLRAELLEGFFPEVAPTDRPRKARAGLRELGLPYASDSAVTRHLAAFLDGQPPVDFLLCNGGTLATPLLRERLCAQLAAWNPESTPRVLDNPEPDLAVARGAAVYAARRKQGRGLMEAGSAQAVYLEVTERKTRDTHYLCILPQGTAPGQIQRSDAHPLKVLVNTPVRFGAASSPRRPQDRTGDLLTADGDDLHVLPPLQSLIELPPKTPRPANNLVEVTVEACLTDVGLLKVRLVSCDRNWKGKGDWELAFQLRHKDETPETPASVAQIPPSALEALRSVFGKKGGNDPKSARHLASELENALRAPRSAWSPEHCRALWPALAEGMTRRQRSKDHEAVWLSLAGYLLRPGFGVALDPARINDLWRLHELGLAFPREARNRTQLWILWRRVAGGLDAERQRLLAESWLEPLSQPGANPGELIRLAAALERIDPAQKRLWLNSWTQRLPKAARDEAAAIAWAYGRVLSRVPFGGGPEDVLPASVAESSLSDLLDRPGLDWSLPELRQLPLRAARLTGITGFDVSEPLRERLCAHLALQGIPEEDLRVLREIIPVEEVDRARLFGETLPPGLLLSRS